MGSQGLHPTEPAAGGVTGPLVGGGEPALWSLGHVALGRIPPGALPVLLGGPSGEGCSVLTPSSGRALRPFAGPGQARWVSRSAQSE